MNFLALLRTRRPYYVALFALLLFGCYGNWTTQNYVKQSNIYDSKSGKDTATIYFYRPNQFVAVAADYEILNNEVEVLRIKNGSYRKINIGAGTANFSVERVAYGMQLFGKKFGDPLIFEAESGKTYYVKVTISPRPFKEKVTMKLVEDSEEFLSLKDGLWEN